MDLSGTGNCKAAKHLGCDMHNTSSVKELILHPLEYKLNVVCIMKWTSSKEHNSLDLEGLPKDSCVKILILSVMLLENGGNMKRLGFMVVRSLV